ncbi:MAG: response regulator [Planctomycetes bacterium]|nr:response regulator [Planctomycetota bacterium]
MGNTLKPAKILLVDDSLSDQKLIKRIFAKQRIANIVHTENCAEDALKYLEVCKNGNIQNELPDLILLDLNMPGMGGKGFLRQIKLDNNLDTIPVVILTTSDSKKDILECYKLNAAGYVKKPVGLQEFYEVVCGLEEYWFAICKLVHREGKHE